MQTCVLLYLLHIGYQNMHSKCGKFSEREDILPVFHILKGLFGVWVEFGVRIGLGLEARECRLQRCVCLFACACVLILLNDRSDSSVVDNMIDASKHRLNHLLVRPPDTHKHTHANNFKD